MIRWHEVEFRVIDHAWFAPTDRGEVVVVDCGKGMPPAIDNLVTIVTAESDGTETAGAWRVRGAEQWCGGTRYGLTVTKATVEDLAAARTGPSWQTGSRVPADRDVWVYIPDWDSGEIELLRGRDEDGKFQRADGEWSGLNTGSAYCWLDAVEQPQFTVETARAGISAMSAPMSDQGRIEAWLHRESLRAVVAGHPDARAIAAAALESRTVKFTRYYS